MIAADSSYLLFQLAIHYYYQIQSNKTTTTITSKSNKTVSTAETRDWTRRDLQIFSLTLSQLSYFGKLQAPMGVEPMISCLLGRRYDQLSHGAAIIL